ncbi:ankyrin repeat domain-containing protein SOWAHB isoform X2 [Gouania willdenowi]|uniref:ankyrin repeat domain-containing protein SOWAHB isoform X2 n=1 Tax=Gouania willdenowi TaxID=441366 RepID=UPI001054E8AA|nr:ankyrin repeat domain-containing protein SOWAHB-like isoform X2 [Gouania willdenowi]
MSSVSEEALLGYFSSAGGESGRVKNADMLRTFKPFIGHSDATLRAKYREEFKLIIDRIAVVKTENGEKFLILKKKYRNSLLDPKLEATNGDRARRVSPARPIAPAPTAAAQMESKEQQQDEPMSCGEWDGAAESDSEQDEESTGSMGSAAVALDPIEKDWIYSAAGARVPDLSQLLRQDPTLANKKDFTSGFTALHWAAKHGNEDMAALVVGAGADVNTKSHGYTPLHIAALHGHQHILDLLIGSYGAKENLRDYSGHLACHYLNTKEEEGREEECDLQFHVTQARERNRNRKLASLFHSKKKWGSAEELAPIEEERAASHQLILPAFRPRKFSR